MIQGHRSMPVLAVADVDKSTDFFVNGLGFSHAGTWKDDDGVSNFAIVVLDGITVGLNVGQSKGSGGPWSAYFYVEDIDAYAAQVTGNGVCSALIMRPSCLTTHVQVLSPSVYQCRHQCAGRDETRALALGDYDIDAHT